MRVVWVMIAVAGTMAPVTTGRADPVDDDVGVDGLGQRRRRDPPPVPEGPAPPFPNPQPPLTRTRMTPAPRPRGSTMTRRPLTEVRRRGFTLAIDGGYGTTVISPDQGGMSAGHGPTLPAVGLGAWLSPRVAVSLQVGGTAYSDAHRTVGGFVGPAALAVLGHAGFVEVGAGLTTRATFPDDEHAWQTERGLGLDLRLGLEVEQHRDDALYVALKASPAWFADGASADIGVVLGYRWM